MLRHRLSFPRILSSNRPLRPPNPPKQHPRPRLFTQNTQLLLICTPPSRPELPFLHLSSGARYPHAPFRSQFRHQLSRLLSTERKRYFKEQLRLGVKLTIYFYVIYFCFCAVKFGIQSEQLERKYPSPPEWSLFTRMEYRIVRGDESPSANPEGLVHFARVGQWYLMVLKRLEDPSIDGADLRPGLKDEGEIYVPEIGDTGIAKGGLDISSKPEPWRRGYHTCLMGAARAAENLDGWVRDTTRNISFPANMMIGPSNPRPKPVPYAAEAAPLEENCVPAYQSPELYYSKILTTQGFSTRQRLDAVIAYADWLDFKGLSATAKETYARGLDIALEALPIEAHNIVDTKTGVITDNPAFISSNLLLATTSLAIHHARNKNLAAALPIFLSILRAKRQLPFPPPNDTRKKDEMDSRKENGLLTILTNFLYTPPYPEAPPSGDEPQFRTPMTLCEEAGIMSHIGEILFASALQPSTKSTTSFASAKTTSSQSLHAGINWTRDAVDTAEATLQATPRQDAEARKKCAVCMEVGVENWDKMVGKMLRNAQSQRQTDNQGKSSSATSGHNTTSNWDLNWPWSSKHPNTTEADNGPERWEREAQSLERRKTKVDQMLRAEGLVTNQEVAPGTEWGLLFR